MKIPTKTSYRPSIAIQKMSVLIDERCLEVNLINGEIVCKAKYQDGKRVHFLVDTISTERI